MREQGRRHDLLRGAVGKKMDDLGDLGKVKEEMWLEGAGEET